MKKANNYLIIVYPYNGQPVYSQRVSCYSEPCRSDIRKLERYFKAKVEVENLTRRAL